MCILQSSLRITTYSRHNKFTSPGTEPTSMSSNKFQDDDDDKTVFHDVNHPAVEALANMSKAKEEEETESDASVTGKKDFVRSVKRENVDATDTTDLEGFVVDPIDRSKRVKIEKSESTVVAPKVKELKSLFYLDFSQTDYNVYRDDSVLRGPTYQDVMSMDPIKAHMNTPDLKMVSLERQKCPREIRNFPSKMYTILSLGHKVSHAIKWLPHGRAFRIINRVVFLEDILLKFSKPIKWSSFTRQLQLWGFKRIHSGRDDGAYYHMLVSSCGYDVMFEVILSI